MTDPRPLAGTDLAPCPDCGGELHAEITKDGSEQWWFIECPACHWCRDVDSPDEYTLATAPWTRALWAELAELRLVLAAEQGRQEGAPGAFVVVLEPGVFVAPWLGDPGRTLDLANAQRFATRRTAAKALADARRYRPFARARVCRVDAMQAADESEAAAAKDPTP